jgi:hypothetical protein
MRLAIAIGIVALAVLIVWKCLIRPEDAIEIAPGPTFDAHDPLATSFIVTNRSFYPLRVDFFTCWYEIKGAKRGLESTDRSLHSLNANARASLHCNQLVPDPDRTTSRVALAIRVYYRLPLIDTQISKGSVYFGQRDSNGDVRWNLVSAEMNESEEVQLMLKQLSLPSYLQDPVVFDH